MHRILVVKVRRCTDAPTQFRWRVLETDGYVLETATRSYQTEAEAFRAGNAAARAIRKRVLAWSPRSVLA